MPEESPRPADHSTLVTRPDRCPHCGEALPAEPEILARGSRESSESYPENLEARYRPTLRRVEVFGGESGFDEGDPLALEAGRVSSARDALRWMGEISAKPWAKGEAFHRKLADSLHMALRDNTNSGGDDRPSTEGDHSSNGQS